MTRASLPSYELTPFNLNEVLEYYKTVCTQPDCNINSKGVVEPSTTPIHNVFRIPGRGYAPCSSQITPLHMEFPQDAPSETQYYNFVLGSLTDAPDKYIMRFGHFGSTTFESMLDYYVQKAIVEMKPPPTATEESCHGIKHLQIAAGMNFLLFSGVMIIDHTQKSVIFTPMSGTFADYLRDMIIVHPKFAEHFTPNFKKDIKKKTLADLLDAFTVSCKSMEEGKDPKTCDNDYNDMQSLIRTYNVLNMMCSTYAFKKLQEDSRLPVWLKGYNVDIFECIKAHIQVSSEPKYCKQDIPSILHVTNRHKELAAQIACIKDLYKKRKSEPISNSNVENVKNQIRNEFRRCQKPTPQGQAQQPAGPSGGGRPSQRGARARKSCPRS